MNTPISMRQSKFDELINVCMTLKNTVTSGNVPAGRESEMLLNALNDLFEEYVCTTVLFTNNTDKILFGIYVSPTVTDTDIINIVLTNDLVQLSRYAIEIDVNIFNKLDGMEVASYIVEDIASTFLQNTIDNARNLLDIILLNDGESIEIKQSVNYSQILTFGMKDTMRKISSLIYKDEDAIGMNKFAEAFEIKEVLVDVAKKLKSSISNDIDAIINPNLSILKWVLMIYKEIESSYKMAEDTLLTAKDITGSILEKREIDRTLKCIRRASTEVFNEATILMEKFSLFRNLKQNGLRSIEDDYYEFKIRLKNCEDENEAMYILRQINTRISILEDYLRNTEVSEAEFNRWRGVIDSYRELRVELGKKKVVNKKQYGIFIDYDKLDELETPNTNSYDY